jgi:hypothetical protein
VSEPLDHREYNVDLLVAKLIIGKMATLHQLKTVYNLQDALYLNEVLDIKIEQIYLANRKLELNNGRSN